MYPSSFSPGDFRHCWLCGELRVESNLASLGEPACRVCGCRKVAGVDADSLNRTRKTIRGLVGEIQQLGKGNLPPNELGPAFLSRLVHALAAMGAVIWRVPKRRSWFKRYPPQIEHEIGYSNHQGGPEFAMKVMRENLAQVTPAKIGKAECLLLGAPLRGSQGVCGAVEVVQRPGAGPTTQRGYLRFMQQVIELVPDGDKLFS